MANKEGSVTKNRGQLGWGIIGAGWISDTRMATAISRVTNTELVAVCDATMEIAKDFAARHKIKRAYDSADKILKDPELDIVYIASPNHLHAEQTIKAAEAGKHVLCEKPMALTLPDCERMIEACEKNKVKLGIQFQNRCHPAHLEARRYFQTGMVGEIHVAEIWDCEGAGRNSWKGWRTDPKWVGAGDLYSIAVHPIDLIRFVLGSEVEEVWAANDLEDMDYVIMKFENGVYVVLISGVLVPRYDNDMVLYGSKAKITCKGTVGMPLVGELWAEGESLNVRRDFPTDDSFRGLYMAMAQAFTECIVEDTEPPATGYDGLENLRVANAILQSRTEGKAIKITR